MPPKKPFFARYALVILMAFAFAAPLVIQSAQRAIKSNTNKVGDWLPESFRETQEFRWFRKHFVADQFVVISWPGCTLGDDPAKPDAQPDDPRIERLAKFLEGPNPGAKAVDGKAGYEGMFQSVTTARRLLDDLTAPPSDIPYPEAFDRLQGTLIGPDGKQTCVVAMLSDAAIQNFRKVLGHHVANGSLPWQRQPGILWKALEQCGIDKHTVRLGGPPVENVAIDEEGGRTIARLGTFSGLLGIALAYWSLRSVKLTAIVFACGILSAAAGLSVVYWTGFKMDAVLMSMPSLLYVLAISGSVHLINYYREAIKKCGLEGAPETAIRYGWKPALLCSVTTAVGLGSLYISDLAPISKFGTFSAIGVMLMLVVLFLFLPAALQLFPARFWLVEKEAPRKKPAKKSIFGAGVLWNEALWGRVCGFLTRHHTAVSIGCILFIVAVGMGITRIHTSIDLLKLFDENARIRRDYAWLEEHVGPLVPMEVVVRVPTDKIRPQDAEGDVRKHPQTLSFLERLELVSLIQTTIDKELGPHGRHLVGPTMAAATFAPSVPEGPRDVWSVARRRVTNEQLEASQKNLQKSGYLTNDHADDAELWRVSLRAAAFAGLDYGLFVESVRSVIEPVLAAERLRELVITDLAAKRGDESLAGATVCIWDPAPPPDAGKQLTDEQANEQKIFTEAWKELLSATRLKLQHTSYDLATLPEDAREQLFQKLREFDAVALTGDFSDAQVAALREAGIHIVDARNILADQMANAAAAHTNSKNIAAVYTGVVPVVYKAQRALLENLMQSSFWSFVTITPLLMFVVRSVAGGAVAMLPNVLPVLVIFGGMSWMGIAVDIGSMMSASIALGVAVDDTIHYLSWFRRDLNRTGDRLGAIQSAYRHCAPPTIQAALISGLGLSVFTLSTFTPTQRLGWLMMTILIAGAVAELVMLPALLAGPLGKVFKIRREEATEPPDDEPPPPPRHDDYPPTDGVSRAKRDEERRVVVENGEPELAAGRQPHAHSLRERLANLRRAARD